MPLSIQNLPVASRITHITDVFLRVVFPGPIPPANPTPEWSSCALNKPSPLGPQGLWTCYFPCCYNCPTVTHMAVILTACRSLLRCPLILTFSDHSVKRAAPPPIALLSHSLYPQLAGIPLPETLPLHERLCFACLCMVCLSLSTMRFHEDRVCVYLFIATSPAPGTG